MNHKPSCSWHDSPEAPCNCGASAPKQKLDFIHRMDRPFLTVYYAHFMAIYDTPQETRDIALLEQLGFEVLNPNTPAHQEHKDMGYYCDLAASCDLVAFRALPDGSISSGVALEIEAAKKAGKPVIELPSGLSRRRLSVESTREALHELGQR